MSTTGELAFVVMVDRAYWSRFLVLYASLRKFHPETPILLYSYESLPETAGCQVFQVPGGHLWNILNRADVLRDAIGRYERIVFLGADTELFGPIRQGILLLDCHDFVAVPHQSAPRADGNELAAASCGILNSDFQLWRRSENSLHILNWYRQRIRISCAETRQGVIDQLWLGLIPSLFPRCLAWRTSCYNVAYWNVDDYDLRMECGEWVTVGGPLMLYHYSGFVGPHILSRYCPVPPSGSVRVLYERYGRLLKG